MMDYPFPTTVGFLEGPRMDGAGTKTVWLAPPNVHQRCPPLHRSVGSVYAREKRKSDQTSLVAHTQHMGDYCRGLNAHSTLRKLGSTAD
jgi:hypothetical protein